VAGSPLVGILALQGDFAAHAAALAGRGVSFREVRSSSDLDGVTGLVFPGGESTTMLRLLGDLEQGLCALVIGGVPTLATCAGLILLAREVTGPPQRSLGLLDVSVLRNAYGRQLDSTVTALEVVEGSVLGGQEVEGVFIRAPRVTRVGPAVETLARRSGDPVLLRQDSILAATFHPELSRGSPVIDLFVRVLGEASRR
jgi:pyridoxal 5'-phosphate synthase pdxT subunit